MSRILLKLILILLLSVPLPGLNILHQTSFAVDRSNLIKGKVIDAETKATIQFATISLLHETDTIPMLLTATDPKGGFSFSNLQPGIYRISVHFMGFKDYLSQPFVINEKSAEIDLEPIPLQIESMALGEITVKSTAGTPTYQLEKKTIYVENQLSGTGGSAYDLLHKLPSVTLNADGQMAIHGNANLLVFINGKPSSMKGTELLEYTAASEVKKIEIITSPSAKYDASGSGGIINLITKKNTLNGLSGNVQASTDQLGGYSSDLLLNYKRDKFSLFAGIDNNKRRNEGDVNYVTSYLTDPSLFTQTGIQKSQRNNSAFRTGFDYTASPFDKILFSSHVGTFKTTNHGDWQIVNTGGATFNIPIPKSALDNNDRPGTYGGADITFEHKFKKPDKVISISALWNALDYNDLYLNLINSPSGAVLTNQSTNLDKKYSNYQINTDFSTPTGKTGTLEIGSQLTFNKEQEIYHSELTNSAPTEVTNQETKFNGMVGAGYGTWQFKVKRLDIKAGLRAEYQNHEMKTLYDRFPLNRFDLYPSLNSSYKIDSMQELSFNYTRRTDQLKTIQLDPLPRWYNFYNVMIGNPSLKNEITDKIAVDYRINFHNLSLVNELYYYNTTDKIEVIQSIMHDQIIRNRYENSGSEKTWGVEVNANWSANKWLRLSEKLDFIDSKLDLTLESTAKRRSYQQWYSVTSAEFTVSPTFMLEMDFSYYGPAMTAQSNIDQCYLAGLNIRKTFLNRKLTFTLSGRDVLGLYKKVEHIDGANFDQVITISNNFPVRFAVSYKFHNYKRDERRVAKAPATE